ncbi:MAG: DUF4365 domain-containing protein, partial [Bacteroidales bacterium]|nr:DUF4365 domain-containing protein [Bacteroidales bacterium]
MSDSQKLGKQGENFVERVFTDAGWNTIIIPGGSDFHSDFSVEIFSNGALTGCRFGVQVKAHRSIKVLKDGSIRQSMKTSTLNAFLEQGNLVILVCYDVTKEVAYWCWIQDYIRQKLPRGWQEKHKPTIKIPSSQILDDSAIEEIRKRVMTHGTKLKFTQLAETTNDPYYNIFPKIDNEGTHLVFSEKFPGASEIDPISFDFSVDFDDTPEGLAVRGAMEKHFKTGSTVAIPGQFITDFKGADVFRRIFGDDTHNKPSLLVVKPNESQQPEPVSFELLDGEGKQLFCFKYLELKVVQ